MNTTVRKIISGTGPFEYLWTTDDTCVTFSDSSGITDQVVETIVYYTSSACLAGATITLEITDANGCTSSTVVVPTDQCDALAASITAIPPFKFEAAAGSAGCANISFTWSYNTNLFSLVSKTETNYTSSIELALKNTTIPASTTVSVTAKDCNDCITTESYVLSICLPQALNYQTVAAKSGSNYVTPQLVLDDPTGCLNYEFDWDTLQLDLPSALWSYSNTDNLLTITTSATPSNYQIRYSVATTDGIRSNKGVITVTVLPEVVGDTITLVDKKFDLDCTVMPGDTVELNIEDLVIAAIGTDVDWSTWQLTNPPSPISSSIELATNIDGDHVIQYEAPTPVSGDSFGWTVADTDGNFAKVTVTTLLDCSGTPTANNDAEDAGCGTTITIDLLSNDLGNGAPLKNNSIVITSGPTYGTVTLPGDGTAFYTCPPNTAGTDTFTYTVQNAFGNTSNEATVTITMLCAGSDVEYTLCD